MNKQILLPLPLAAAAAAAAADLAAATAALAAAPAVAPPAAAALAIVTDISYITSSSCLLLPLKELIIRAVFLCFLCCCLYQLLNFLVALLPFEGHKNKPFLLFCFSLFVSVI